MVCVYRICLIICTLTLKMYFLFFKKHNYKFLKYPFFYFHRQLQWPPGICVAPFFFQQLLSVFSQIRGLQCQAQQKRRWVQTHNVLSLLNASVPHHPPAVAALTEKRQQWRQQSRKYPHEVFVHRSYGRFLSPAGLEQLFSSAASQ